MNVDDAVNMALEMTGKLIETIGPRPSGSEESRRVADFLQRDAASFADNAWTDDFSVHPKAFLGWLRLLVIVYIVAVALLWLEVFWLAAMLTTLGTVLLVGQFFQYRELIDRFYPKKIGRNVLAVVEPEQPVRGQLIVSGHHDSAFVFNFFIHQPELYSLRATGSIVTYFLLLIVSWILTIWRAVASTPPEWGIVPTILFTLLILLFGQLWWYASSESTPGAGDNLASSAAAWQTLRVIAERKARGEGLQHLRVIAASWDAEEAGLRGARNWVKNGADGRLDLATWNLNLECLYDAEELYLLTTDINGSVKLSAELAARCQRLLSDDGEQIPTKPIAFLTGGTDAGELAKGGIEATTLVGMAWGNDARATAYHTPGDVLETVDPKALKAAIRLSLDLALELDQELSTS